MLSGNANLIDGDLDSIPQLGGGSSRAGGAPTTAGPRISGLEGGLTGVVGGLAATTNTHFDPGVSNSKNHQVSDDEEEDDVDEDLCLPGAEERPEREALVSPKEDQQIEEKVSQSSSADPDPDINVQEQQSKDSEPSEHQDQNQHRRSVVVSSLPSGISEEELSQKMMEAFGTAAEESLASFQSQFTGGFQPSGVLTVGGNTVEWKGGNVEREFASLTGPSEGVVASTFSPFLPESKESTVRQQVTLTTLKSLNELKSDDEKREREEIFQAKGVSTKSDVAQEKENAARIAAITASKKKQLQAPVASAIKPSHSKIQQITDEDEDLECEELNMDFAEVVGAEETQGGALTPGSVRALTPTGGGGGVSLLMTDDEAAAEVRSSVKFDNFTDEEEDEGGWSAQKLQVPMDRDVATSGRRMPLLPSSGSSTTAGGADQVQVQQPILKRAEAGQLTSEDDIFKSERVLEVADGEVAEVEAFGLDDDWDYDCEENIRGKHWDRFAEFRK